MSEQEIKYLEYQIKEYQSFIGKAHYEKSMSIQYEGSFDEEYPGWTKTWIKARIADLYRMTMTYFELKGVITVKQSFEQEYTNLINDKENGGILKKNLLILNQRFQSCFSWLF